MFHRMKSDEKQATIEQAAELLARQLVEENDMVEKDILAPHTMAILMRIFITQSTTCGRHSLFV